MIFFNWLKPKPAVENLELDDPVFGRMTYFAQIKSWVCRPFDSSPLFSNSPIIEEMTYDICEIPVYIDGGPDGVADAQRQFFTNLVPMLPALCERGTAFIKADPDSDWIRNDEFSLTSIDLPDGSNIQDGIFALSFHFDSDDDGDYGLRYENFIPVNHWRDD